MLRALSCVRLIAKMPTIAAMAYKTSIGQAIIYPNNDYTLSENFLYMMFSTKNEVRSPLARIHLCGGMSTKFF